MCVCAVYALALTIVMRHSYTSTPHSLSKETDCGEMRSPELADVREAIFTFITGDCSTENNSGSDFINLSHWFSLTQAETEHCSVVQLSAPAAVIVNKDTSVPPSPQPFSSLPFRRTDVCWSVPYHSSLCAYRVCVCVSVCAAYSSPRLQLRAVN